VAELDHRLIYSVTPLSTTALFTAAGVGESEALAHVAAVLLRQISERRGDDLHRAYAAANYKNLMQGSYSPREL